MISKKELKQLLKDGLSGQEAGRLVLLDSVEVDHGRPGFLTPEDLEKIKRSLFPEEASVYNDIVYAYQIYSYSILEGRNHFLEAWLVMERAFSPLSWLRMEALLQAARELHPIIWTARQAQEQTPPEGRKIAIIQDPDPDDLDDRGYYVWPEYLSEEGIRNYTWVRLMLDDLESKGIDFAELLLSYSEQARHNIKALLAYQQALEELGRLLDVPLTEDFGPWLEDLEDQVDAYNSLLTETKDDPFKLTIKTDKGQKLTTIRLSMLKADTEILAYMRERIAMAMGPDWWLLLEEAGHGR